MSITEIYIQNKKYRYSLYKHHDPQVPHGIFLMGNLQEIESVEFFSKQFSQELNLLVIEIPGTGMTNPLSATFTIEDQARMLLSFIKNLGVPSAHLLAFSYATPVALELCTLWKNAKSLSMCGGMAGIPTSSRLQTMAILGDAIRDRKRFAEEFIKGLTVDDKSIPRGKVIARSAKQKVFQYSDKQISCFCENTVRILGYIPSNRLEK